MEEQLRTYLLWFVMLPWGFMKTTGWIDGNLKRAKYTQESIRGLRANVLQQAEGGLLQIHRKLGD